MRTLLERAHLALVLAAVAAGVAPVSGTEVRIGPFLRQLRSEYRSGGERAVREAAALRGLPVREGSAGTLVPVVLEPAGKTAASAIDTTALEAQGARVDAVSASFMRVLVPAALLGKLEGLLADVEVARTPYPAVCLGATGACTSEAVSLTGASALHAAGQTGAGVKVAVVDLGFTGLQSAQAQGELPAALVAVDFSGTGIEADTAHGVAVAEHVYDMAPGATIYCLKVGDEVDLEQAASYIASEGIAVANHSVGWVLASYYDDSGPINTIINTSRDGAGVFWAVAAGNDANQHWRGTWQDADGDGILDFAGTDERLGLTSGSSLVSLFLNWNQYGNSLTDLNLYVLDARGRVVAASTATQTGSQEPSEAVAFRYSARNAPYSVEVRHRSGPTTGLDLTLFSFYNTLEYAVAAGSLMDPADAHGAFAAAAIDQADWRLAEPPAESYSSQGPTNDGRQKPDITAPDGTSSWTYGTVASYGTSFSSPTVAGAAALLIGADPSLAGDPVTVAARLSALAKDVGQSGTDPVFGAGRLWLADTPNTAPAAVDDTATTVAGTAVTIDVLANDSDPDGDALTVTAVTAGANGAVSTDGRRVTYTPVSGFTGNGTFTYTIADGNGGSATASVTVTVKEAAVVAMSAAITRTALTRNRNGASTATATVRVFESARPATAVARARVTVVWSGGVSGTSTGTTNWLGVVTLTSPQIRRSTTAVTVTVTEVTKTGYLYDDGAPRATVSSLK